MAVAVVVEVVLVVLVVLVVVLLVAVVPVGAAVVLCAWGRVVMGSGVSRDTHREAHVAVDQSLDREQLA